MHHSRQRATSLLLVLCVFAGTAALRVVAQSKSMGADKSPLCTRDNALDMIKQQVAVTKTFNDSKRRITVLLRAADLLWPYEQKRARSTFTEAFDLAVEHEKESEQSASSSIILRMRVPDQRHIVIRAIARRDYVWAKDLVKQIAKPDRETTDSVREVLTGARLLDSANNLISTDINAALELAGMSLNYPAGFMLTHFLYRLAEVNQQLSDRFYAQALTAYGEKPMREFLYLQAYPFAWRETVNTPVFSFHRVPANFVRNQSLQRRFLQVLLGRAQQVLEVPLDLGDSYQSQNQVRMPGRMHLLQGLIKLEPQVRESLPDLLAPLIQAREKILVSLPVDSQQSLAQPGREVSTKQAETFDEQIELAQKTPDADERDQIIAAAVFGSEREPLPGVIQAIDKISNSALRSHLFEWLHFQRATAAIGNKHLEEAETLASRVEGLEQRAYLHVEIARQLLTKTDTQTHGREVLEVAISEAKKAGITIFAARSLLSAWSLYAKIDPGQSISLLADAINCINRLEAPDFISDGQAVEKEIERRAEGGSYGGEYSFHYYMPGLDPERAIREMARLDFDTALAQSSSLSDKFQRALSTLALADACLQHPKPAKEKLKRV